MTSILEPIAKKLKVSKVNTPAVIIQLSSRV